MIEWDFIIGLVYGLAIGAIAHWLLMFYQRSDFAARMALRQPIDVDGRPCYLVPAERYNALVNKARDWDAANDDEPAGWSAELPAGL